MEYKAAKERLLDYLDGWRYEHSLGVARLAARLAETHGVDAERARWAGLLHDAAKERPQAEFLERVRSGAIDCDPETLATPGLHHAVHGAWLARTVFGVADPEILEAIAVHPTGAPGLGALGCVLFVADYCEESRDWKGRDDLRDAAAADLTEACLEVCGSKLKHLMKKRRPIHSRTVAFYNDLLNRQGAVN